VNIYYSQSCTWKHKYFTGNQTGYCYCLTITGDDTEFLEEIVGCYAGLKLQMNNFGKLGLIVPIKNYKVGFTAVRITVCYIWRYYGGNLRNAGTCLYITG
jgi:hypothetical protein